MILDLSHIGTNYLKSWFVVDLLAVFPFPALYVATGFVEPAFFWLRFLKFLRFLRLPRMAYVISKSDPLNSLQDVLGLSFAVKVQDSCPPRLFVCFCFCSWSHTLCFFHF